MGDLARRRNARDLWISRSHLWALAAGMAVLAATTFLVGMSVGRSRAMGQAEGPRAFVSEVPDEALVALLARVEASSDPLGGIDLLTFPGELSRVPVPLVAVGPPLPPGMLPPVDAVDAPPPASPDEPLEVVDVDAGQVATPTVADPRPSGAFTVEVGRFEGAESAREAVALRNALRAAGQDGWLALELVKGVPRYRVSVGGFGDQAAAGEAIAAVRAAVSDTTPTVVPLH